MVSKYIVISYCGDRTEYLSGSGRFVKTKRLAWRYDSFDDAKIVADSFAAIDSFLRAGWTFAVKALF